MPSREDLLEIAKRIRYDLTAAQAKLTELTTLVAGLPVSDPGKSRCPVCDLAFPGERSLAEHRYVSHDGPEPKHWLEAERKADLEPPEPSPPEDELAKRRGSG